MRGVRSTMTPGPPVSQHGPEDSSRARFEARSQLVLEAYMHDDHWSTSQPADWSHRASNRGHLGGHGPTAVSGITRRATVLPAAGIFTFFIGRGQMAVLSDYNPSCRPVGGVHVDVLASTRPNSCPIRMTCRCSAR